MSSHPRAAASEILWWTGNWIANPREACFGSWSPRSWNYAKSASENPPAVHAILTCVLNADAFTPGQMLALAETAISGKALLENGTLSPAAEAQVQFQARLQLAKYGLTPPDRVNLAPRAFGHPSEEIFANLLDFYRIAWEYEPRSFPLQWDKDGKVLEAFTPDFYLPEFDMFVELTTMKQTLVTRKNRKIRLLRAIYPHVNIQVFYQKDIQDLIMKYGLAGKAGS